MSAKRHCIVLAGGLGTRLQDVTNDRIPKALTPILGRPFLDFKISSLIEMKIDHIWILVGRHGNQIASHIERMPKLDSEISVLEDGNQLLGTAGAIRKHIEEFPNEFWITYGDTYVSTDLETAEMQVGNAGMRIMCVFHNRNLIEPSNVAISTCLVSAYNKEAPQGKCEWIDYGLMKFHKSDFDPLPSNTPSDMASVIGPLIYKQRLWAWTVEDRFWEIGTPQSLMQTEAHFRTKGWPNLW